MSGCQWFDPMCKAKEAINTAVGDAASQSLQTMADGVSAAAGKFFGAVGSLWVVAPTPELTGSSKAVATPLPGSLTDVLGYVQWIGLGVAGLAVIILAVAFVHHDRTEQTRSRVIQIVGGVLILSSASTIVAHLVGGSGERASSTVAFLRGELMSFTMWAAVLGTLIAAIRLIVSNARAAMDWFSGMVTLMLVSAASATIAQGLVAALDAASLTIINHALSCEGGTGSSCFGTSLSTIMGSAITTSPGVVAGANAVRVIVIFLALIALVTSFIQMILMLIRGGMLVALVGGMPLAAAAAMAGDHGKQWWHRYLAWFLAFASYKPVAAIIYATGFQMVGELSTGGEFSEIISAASGIALLLAALVALPALMRFWAPITAVVASGSGGGAAGAAAVGGVAQGAAQIVGSSPSTHEPSGSAALEAGGHASVAPNGGESGAVGGGTQAAASSAQSAGSVTGGGAVAGPAGVAAAAGLQVVGTTAQVVHTTVNDAAGGE